MALHHLGILKTVTWVLGAAAVAIVAMDPTIKVALIVSAPPTLTGILAFILGLMNRKELKVIKVDVNTNFQKLLREKEEQNKEMAAKSDQLSHAQGRREGIESTECSDKREMK